MHYKLQVSISHRLILITMATSMRLVFCIRDMARSGVALMHMEKPMQTEFGRTSGQSIHFQVENGQVQVERVSTTTTSAPPFGAPQAVPSVASVLLPTRLVTFSACRICTTDRVDQVLAPSV